MMALLSSKISNWLQAQATDEDGVYKTSSSDYLRITKDADLFARINIVRLSRRLSVVDVVCWQDNEDVPVVRGAITIKITA